MDEAIPQRLQGDGLLLSCEKNPHKTAVVIDGKEYSYVELKDSALKMAFVLKQRGVKRGDRVAIYMENSWSCIISIYGVIFSGAVFIVINPQTKREKLKFILEDSGSKVLISDSHLADVFFPIVDNIKGLRTLIVSGQLLEKMATILHPKQFERLLEESKPLEKPEFVIPNDLVALIYTSGSTGFPKGVMQTHQSTLFASISIIEYLRLTSKDRIMLVLPLAFDYGLYQLLMSVIVGATLVVEHSFVFFSQIYKHINERTITVFPGVPSIYTTLVNSYKKSGITFPSVKTITNTAATLQKEIIPILAKIFPNAQIYKMYGLTECKRVSYLEPKYIKGKADSVGKAIPGTEVFLLSKEGKPVKKGEAGILHVRGPHIMVGYWNRPKQTAKMLKPGNIPGEHILCTHDWFRIDEQGFLYYIERDDDIIKTRGEKVSPKEVENVLEHISGVKEAIVVGVPDPTLGELIRACVLLNSNADLTEKNLKMICSKNLENFMIPQEIFFLEHFPHLANGKIDKKYLEEMGTKN